MGVSVFLYMKSLLFILFKLGFYAQHMKVWWHKVFQFVSSFVRPTSLCECNFSEVVGRIVLVCRIIGPDM
jgi:hypothetical protein